MQPAKRVLDTPEKLKLAKVTMESWKAEEARIMRYGPHLLSSGSGEESFPPSPRCISLSVFFFLTISGFLLVLLEDHHSYMPI
jgi:hypothetical protein